MIDKQLIHDFLIELSKETQLGDDDSLLETKLLDSLKVMELVVFLEKQFIENILDVRSGDIF